MKNSPPVIIPLGPRQAFPLPNFCPTILIFSPPLCDPWLLDPGLVIHTSRTMNLHFLPFGSSLPHHPQAWAVFLPLVFFCTNTHVKEYGLCGFYFDETHQHQPDGNAETFACSITSKWKC